MLLLKYDSFIYFALDGKNNQAYTSNMEQFYNRSNSSDSITHCAEMVIDTIPAVMSAFRGEMRARRPSELSIPQFRTLIHLQYHSGASISQIASHLGLALSSTSQLVDGLLKRQYVTREIAEGDRRRAIVKLTEHGNTMLNTVREQAQARMEEHLLLLSEEESQIVTKAMVALARIFQKKVVT